MAWLAVVAGSTALAQTDETRVMGMVTDVSGGSLPGVTVTLSGTARAPISVFTDGSGRYITPSLPPGTYTVTFLLSGFETRVLKNVPLTAGHTVVLDQQMALAALTETVEVVATAPPPPPPAPVRPLVPRPVLKPVAKELLASVCGPRQSTNFTLAIGKVVSHRDDPGRQLLGPGDRLRIDAGEAQGVAVGQNLVVRRKIMSLDYDWGLPKKQQPSSEETAGLVQIVEVTPSASVGAVLYACGEIAAGDTVEPFAPQTAYATVALGTPHFEEPGRITFGGDGRMSGSPGQMMVIDRGIMQGAQRGQRITIFRTLDFGGRSTIGDGVVVSVRADSATILIGSAVDAVSVGDMVALHR